MSLSEVSGIIWSLFGFASLIAMLFIIPILYEVYKTLKSYRLISERLEMASDFRSWFKVIRFFKSDRK